MEVKMFELNDKNREMARNLAAAMYTGEPCRICGENITMEDLENGAVFAGYSADEKARSAHKHCWDKQIPQSEWRHQ